MTSADGAGVAKAPPPETICSSLADGDLCLPCGLARLERQPQGPPVRRKRLARHEALFHEGDGFRAIYAVRAGSLKTLLRAADGTEQVAGFHLPGEILGIDGIARDRHASTAIALEDAEVLVLPYPGFWSQQPMDSLHGLLQRLISREMLRERERLQLLWLLSAEARLSAFLLDLSRRMQRRGFSPVDFVLRPTRQEIGSYLGLKLETISRAFGRLQRQRLLQVDGKHVHLLDVQGLQVLEGARS